MQSPPPNRFIRLGVRYYSYLFDERHVEHRRHTEFSNSCWDRTGSITRLATGPLTWSPRRVLAFRGRNDRREDLGDVQSGLRLNHASVVPFDRVHRERTDFAPPDLFDRSHQLILDLRNNQRDGSIVVRRAI